MASDVANLTKLTEGKFNVETGDRVTEFENIKHISTPLQLMLLPERRPNAARAAERSRQRVASAGTETPRT